MSHPVNVRLKGKKGEEPVALLDHAKSMLRELALWLPDHAFRLVADGVYAFLARRERLVSSRTVVWAYVSKRPLLLLLSRGPTGK